MKKILFTIMAGAVSASVLAVSPLQKADGGLIDRLEVYSPQMGDTVTVDVWTPEGFNESSRLPVIYMHDGQNLFDASTTWNRQAWEMDSVITAMVADGRMEPVMVVGVHSVAATRVADLMPQKPFTADSLSNPMGEYIKSPLRGDAYAEFIAVTLRELINDHYHPLTDRDNTAVMGSSMGGLMSIYMLCEYPDVFGKAACLSTHWVGNTDSYRDGDERFPEAMYRYIDETLPRGDHKLYFDRGTATIDAYYDKWDDRIVTLCYELGYTPETLHTYVARGAKHEEDAWKRRVHRPLKFMFGR